MADTGDKTDEEIEAENEAYAQSLEADISENLASIKSILINHIVEICQNINSVLNIMNKNIKPLNHLYKHVHMMHKHGFLRGHSYSECLNFDCIEGNSEKCDKNLGCLYPNIISFVRLLYSEYLSMYDKDDNGIVFFKDFYIDYLDPNVPLLLRSLLYNIYFPNTIRFPYRDKDGIHIKYDKEFINYNFEWNGTVFSYSQIPRSEPLQCLTWNQYLKTVAHIM
jgi:hypothetical protein